jgi:TatA/E family protein of Tat protein translocase
MPQISMPEILVIGFLLLVFFGKNKLPEAARSIGQSFKAFKEEINLDKMMESDKPSATKTAETKATEINLTESPKIVENII